MVPSGRWRTELFLPWQAAFPTGTKRPLRNVVDHLRDFFDRRLDDESQTAANSAVDGCIVGRMPKMQVYLPDELYEKIKSRTAHLNVSGILQEALAQRLDQLERQDALAAAVDSYTAEFGAFSDEELNRQADADKKQMARPRTKKKAPSAA